MSLLETSQIIFNLVVSFAIIIFAILISAITYSVTKFIKSVKKLADGINKESAELYKKIGKFFESIFSLSFISKIFKKNKK